jgi:hypothetical protein
MLMFNIADGLGIGKPSVARGTAYQLGLPQEPARTPRREAPPAPQVSRSAPGTDGARPSGSLPPENKWVATRSRLRALGARIDAWRSGGASAPVDPAALTLARLQSEAGIKDEYWRDAWETRIQFIPGTDGYRLVSAGPDQLFGTADDIQFRKVVRP